MKYLNNPTTAFKRVTDANGNLVPSSKMKAYHPGKGVYRSAYKNALRVAKEEKRRASRSMLRKEWMKDGEVIGIRISFSPAHPDYGYEEICEVLEGDYPIEMDFQGWHTGCQCYDGTDL
jgi:hypothetical protein